jgi:biotin/methionine sulfoxide reductase
VLFEDFRADPEKHPLKTPSGRIEIASDAIARLDYDDCPPHPVWIAPAEWLGSPQAERFPVHLVTNQPATRLHSQQDPGPFSAASKVAGREPIHINSADAARRNIRDGDVVRVFNDRGACLAGAVLDDGVLPQVAVMATGAWLDQSEGEPERHGNPNVLTLDVGTSRLTQGCAALTALVEIERFHGPLPPLRAFTPPKLAGADDARVK